MADYLTVLFAAVMALLVLVAVLFVCVVRMDGRIDDLEQSPKLVTEVTR